MLQCTGFGGIAQLVERLNGIQKVRGSTPLVSTTDKKTNSDTKTEFVFFFSRDFLGVRFKF